MALNKYARNIILPSGECEAESEYWKQKLCDATASGFQPDFPRNKSETSLKESISWLLPDNVSQKLLNMGNNSPYAVFMILLAGVDYLLHLFTSNDDLTIWTPVFRQPGDQAQTYINHFIVLRNLIDLETTFRQILLEIKQSVSEAEQYQNFSFEGICELVKTHRGKDGRPVFPTVVLLENIHEKDWLLDVQTEVIFSFAINAETIQLDLQYDTELFRQETIRHIGGYLLDFFSAVLVNPQIKLSELKLSSAEDRQLVKEYNNTVDSFANNRALHTLVCDQVPRFSRKVAVICEGQEITYEELERQSNRIARYLIKRGVSRGDLVGVLTHRSINSVVSILGVLKSGAAYVPIDPDYPEERRKYILSNSQCKLLLDPRDCQHLDLAKYSDRAIGNNNHPEDVAYVIYTSGSTGTPKGVVVTHLAAANTIIEINRRFNVGPTDRIVGLSSFCFDLSVYDIFGTLSAGATLVMVPDQRDARNIARVLCDQAITVWNSVPAIMDLLVSNLPLTYHNETLRLVLLSGDWVPLKLPERIWKYFPNAKIISLGGATEASIWSIYYPVEGIKPEWTSIPYGKPLANQKFYVLNSEMNICPIGVQGELYIGGAGVAQGYYNNPEQTQNSFIHHSELGYLYKTGDYGLLHSEGYIEFLGRRDYQVKIRGYRIELGEIEKVLFRLEGIKNVVVVDKTDPAGEKCLCAYIVTSREISLDEFRVHLSSALPEYMIPTYFTRLDKIPLTPNGKIDRKALPLPDWSGGSNRSQVAPRNEVEKELAEIWEEVLNIRPIGVFDRFFELGGNSISMAQIIVQIGERFKVELGFRDFAAKNTIADLAELIVKNRDASAKEVYPEDTADWERLHEAFPLTEVQTAYLMGRSGEFEIGNVSTHAYVEIETELDLERLNWSLNQLIQRHPMLRAIVFPTGEQVILKDIPEYRIEVLDLRNLATKEQTQRILTERNRMSHYKFKSEEWPLFEIKAFQLEADKHYLCIGLDPLVADAASMQMLSRELIVIYHDSEVKLPRLNYTFRDYVLACRRFKSSALYQQDKAFWHRKLDDFPPAPALPFKQEPEKISTPHFRRLEKVLPSQDWITLKKVAQRKGFTPSALLCSAYAEVLAYWSNQPRLAVNLTLFNRYPFHKDVNKIVGDFTSILLLDLEMTAASFWDRVKVVQEKLLDALEHRHYDGVEMIREIARRNNLRTKAIMPVVFTSMLIGRDGEPEEAAEIGEVKMSVTQTSQVYLDHQVIETREGLQISWDYVEELFEDQIIQQMFSHYVALLTSLITGDENYQFELSADDLRLLEAYNSTGEHIGSSTLHQLFVKQAKLTPENVAVVFEDRHLSYRDLDERSNQVANYLKGQGVGRGDTVGVLAQRVPETIVNVLGILKAGAAYVPVDPEYPDERRRFILENSDCRLLLEPTYTGCLWEDQPCIAPEDIAQPEDNAYVIYTSGSTGQPKGVIITHGAATNTVMDINRKFNLNEKDRLIGLSSLCFDLSVYDIFGALSAGASLVQVSDPRDVKKVEETLKSHKVTVWNSVPVIMGMLTDNLAGHELLVIEGDHIASRNVEQCELTDSLGQKVYYWSPVLHWHRSGSSIQIGQVTYSGVALQVFPKLYFLTQNGVDLDSLMAEFPEVNRESLQAFLGELIRNRVLINTIMPPREVFSTQDSLFRNKYGEELILDSEAYHRFKTQQLNRSFDGCGTKEVPLETCIYPKTITLRRTCRKFNEKAKISFRHFSQFLGACRQTRSGDEVSYYYASGGGLYPLDLFVYVKRDRIEGVAEGLYYYDPVTNGLRLVNAKGYITDEAHYYTNKAIFNSSAFSLFFIYNAGVSMPRYGSMGYFYAAIDTGILIGLLTQIGEALDIGICSIGDMNFDSIASHFRLSGNHVWLHTVEAGLKPNKGMDLKRESLFPVSEEIVEPGSQTLASKADGFSLRLVMLSGDWIPLGLPEKVKEHFSGVEMVSLGGATEASIWSIYYPIHEKRKEWPSVPYGVPLANQQFYVLNFRNEQCPVGIQGELYIGGSGLARGYMNDPVKTEQAFIDHPQFGRLYRTGDYGVLHQEGYIEFLGRKDQQVKIKGYRIELGEVENSLLKMDGVKEVVIKDCTTPNGSKYLCAYVVANRELKAAEIRQFLRGELPEYMVPLHFIQLEKMPLTSNGKVNRKALPHPQSVLGSSDRYVAPRNQVEENLTTLWTQMLGVERVGVHDNFFELGGDSLKATLLMRRICMEWDVEIPLGEVFRDPSISAIARYITQGRGDATGALGDDNLVLLRRGTGKRNLFLIHGGSGEVQGYVDFCNNLGLDHSCWGVRSERFDNYSPRNLTVSQLASEYLERIRRIQPQGPYELVGWCFGGTVAFEMVRQLEQAGENVAFFALVNSIAPEQGIWGEIKEFTADSEKNLILNHLPVDELTEKIKELDRVEQIWPVVVNYILEKGITRKLIEPAIPEATTRVIPNYDQLSVRELLYYLNVVRTFVNTRALYTPQGKIAAELHFFEATDSPTTNKNLWGLYCTRQPVFYRVEGDHFSIFTDTTKAQQFARFFTDVLDKHQRFTTKYSLTSESML